MKPEVQKITLQYVSPAQHTTINWYTGDGLLLYPYYMHCMHNYTTILLPIKISLRNFCCTFTILTHKII